MRTYISLLAEIESNTGQYRSCGDRFVVDYIVAPDSGGGAGRLLSKVRRDGSFRQHDYDQKVYRIRC